MKRINPGQIDSIQQLLKALINQEKAEIIIPAQHPKPGFWFGGGKLAAGEDSVIWLSGRYRNAGDSRTGLEAGVRGAELGIFRSDDGGATFAKVNSWTKGDLDVNGHGVISIEGTALHQRIDGAWELFISSEKIVPYPKEVRHYQKPGTGVWSIDRMVGSSPGSLDLKTLEPALENPSNPAYLHIKDPAVFDDPKGDTILIFCSHPFGWTSDNTGFARRAAGTGSFEIGSWEVVPRGVTWDVAVTRITSRLQIPSLGSFENSEPLSIYFYDGAECMRNHHVNERSHKRPRGYSCEELGGAFAGWTADYPKMERISSLEPLFVSPWGTGASRYVDCISTADGILAVWQQSQLDGSQPLVRHLLPTDEVNRILSKD